MKHGHLAESHGPVLDTCRAASLDIFPTLKSAWSFFSSNLKLDTLEILYNSLGTP